MLQKMNDEKFKLNLQLFAEDDEIDEPVIETLTKEEFEAKLKEVDDKYAGIITGYENKFKELETKLGTPEIKKEKTELENEEKIPAWAKALIEKNEQLERSILQNNDNKLSEKKINLKETFGLDDSDLEDIKDEKSLNILEKNLKKLSDKKEKEMEQKLPSMLKEKGFEVSQYNEITKNKEKLQKTNEKVLSFLRNKKR